MALLLLAAALFPGFVTGYTWVGEFCTVEPQDTTQAGCFAAGGDFVFANNPSCYDDRPDDVDLLLGSGLEYEYRFDAVRECDQNTSCQGIVLQADGHFQLSLRGGTGTAGQQGLWRRPCEVQDHSSADSYDNAYVAWRTNQTLLLDYCNKPRKFRNWDVALYDRGDITSPVAADSYNMFDAQLVARPYAGCYNSTCYSYKMAQCHKCPTGHHPVNLPRERYNATGNGCWDSDTDSIDPTCCSDTCQSPTYENGGECVLWSPLCADIDPLYSSDSSPDSTTDRECSVALIENTHVSAQNVTAHATLNSVSLTISKEQHTVKYRVNITDQDHPEPLSDTFLAASHGSYGSLAVGDITWQMPGDWELFPNQFHNVTVEYADDRGFFQQYTEIIFSTSDLNCLSANVPGYDYAGPYSGSASGHPTVTCSLPSEANALTGGYFKPPTARPDDPQAVCEVAGNEFTFQGCQACQSCTSRQFVSQACEGTNDRQCSDCESNCADCSTVQSATQCDVCDEYFYVSSDGTCQPELTAAVSWWQGDEFFPEGGVRTDIILTIDTLESHAFQVSDTLTFTTPEGFQGTATLSSTTSTGVSLTGQTVTVGGVELEFTFSGTVLAPLELRIEGMVPPVGGLDEGLSSVVGIPTAPGGVPDIPLAYPPILPSTLRDADSAVSSGYFAVATTPLSGDILSTHATKFEARYQCWTDGAACAGVFHQDGSYSTLSSQGSDGPFDVWARVPSTIYHYILSSDPLADWKQSIYDSWIDSEQPIVGYCDQPQDFVGILNVTGAGNHDILPFRNMLAGKSHAGCFNSSCYTYRLPECFACPAGTFVKNVNLTADPDLCWTGTELDASCCDASCPIGTYAIGQGGFACAPYNQPCNEQDSTWTDAAVFNFDSLRNCIANTITQPDISDYTIDGIFITVDFPVSDGAKEYALHLSGPVDIVYAVSPNVAVDLTTDNTFVGGDYDFHVVAIAGPSPPNQPPTSDLIGANEREFLGYYDCGDCADCVDAKYQASIAYSAEVGVGRTDRNENATATMACVAAGYVSGDVQFECSRNGWVMVTADCQECGDVIDAYCPAGVQIDMTDCSLKEIAVAGTSTTDRQCQDCSAGWSCLNQPSGGRDQQCAAGSFSQVGDGICSDCPEGNQCPGLGNTQGTPCSPGFFQDSEGRPSCDPWVSCQPRFFMSVPGTTTSSPVCAQCPVGNKCPDVDMPAGTPCGPGQYQDQQGQIDCDPWVLCQPTTIISVPGTTSSSPECEACPLGYKCPDVDMATGILCDPGFKHYQDETGQTDCKTWGVCAAGEYISVQGTSTNAQECSACVAGTFSDVEDSLSCRDWTFPAGDCPDGMYEVRAGSSTTDHICVNQQECDPGLYVVSESGGDRVCEPCDANSYSQETNSDACISHVDCDPGSQIQAGSRTSTTPQVCEPCQDGFFSSQINAVTCSPQITCSNVQFYEESPTQTSSGSCAPCLAGYRCVSPINQVLCDEGFWAEAGDTTCVPCEAGFYCPQTGDIIKYQCTTGQYCPEGSIAPQTCPVGFQCPSPSTSVPCAAGTYSPDGAAVCTNCQLHKWSLPESESCTLDCRPGYQCQNGLEVECADGRFSPGGAACTPWTTCATGTSAEYIATAGTKLADRVCAACPEGSRCDGTNQIACGDGDWSNPADRSSCTACPAGSACLNGAKTDCPTTAFSTGGQSVCTPCSPHTVCTRTSQENCPAGQDTEPTFPFGDCTQCDAGFSSPGGVACEECPVGTYTVDNIACVSCPAGTFGDADIPRSSEGHCVACPAGFFCPGNGQKTPCAVDTDSGPSATSQADCAPCQPDGGQTTYSSLGVAGCRAARCTAGTGYVDGSADCVACPIGSFSSADESLREAAGFGCTACDAGLTTLSASSQQCDDQCTGGTYSDPVLTEGVCSQCPVGSETLDGQVCTSCTAGTFSGTDEASCVNCPAGSFSSEDGASVCTPCGSGTFQDDEGETQCKECAVGTARDATDPDQQSGISCTACPAGHVALTTRKIACDPCPAGTSAAAGTNECIPCGEGTFNSDVGQASCDECPLGTFHELTEQTTSATCEQDYAIPFDDVDFALISSADGTAFFKTTNPQFVAGEAYSKSFLHVQGLPQIAGLTSHVMAVSALLDVSSVQGSVPLLIEGVVPQNTAQDFAAVDETTAWESSDASVPVVLWNADSTGLQTIDVTVLFRRALETGANDLFIRISSPGASQSANAVVDSLSFNVQMKQANDRPTTLTGAQFLDDGLGIRLSFSAPVKEELSDCDQVFSITPSDHTFGERCRVEQSTAYRTSRPSSTFPQTSYLIVTFDAGATIVPGDTIEIIAGGIKTHASSVHGAGADDGVAAADSTGQALIMPPAAPQAPEFDAVYPTDISYCDAWTIRIRDIVGVGNRQPTYTWKINGIQLDAAVQLEYAFRTEVNNGVLRATFPRLEIGGYTVSLKTVNFFGGETSKEFTFTKRALAFPSLSLDRDHQEVTARRIQFSFLPLYEAPRCGTSMATETTWTWEWFYQGEYQLLPANLYREGDRNLNIRRQDYRQIFDIQNVDENGLVQFRCKVVTQGVPEPLYVHATAELLSTELRVTDGSLSVGPDTDVKVSLDITDRDARIRPLTVSVDWSCQMGFEDCDDALLTELINQGQPQPKTASDFRILDRVEFILSPNLLPPGNEFHLFSLAKVEGTNRTAMGSFHITVDQRDIPPCSLSYDWKPFARGRGMKLELTEVASPYRDLRLEYSWFKNGQPLSVDDALTDTVAQRWVAIRSTNLDAGTAVQFKVRVTKVNVFCEAEVSVDVPRPPSFGGCYASRPDGSPFGAGLNTLRFLDTIVLNAANWIPEDVELTYSFWRRSGDAINIIQGDSPASSVDTIVPNEGEVWFGCTISNPYGAVVEVVADGNFTAEALPDTVAPGFSVVSLVQDQITEKFESMDSTTVSLLTALAETLVAKEGQCLATPVYMLPTPVAQASSLQTKNALANILGITAVEVVLPSNGADTTSFALGIATSAEKIASSCSSADVQDGHDLTSYDALEDDEELFLITLDEPIEQSIIRTKIVGILEAAFTDSRLVFSEKVLLWCSDDTHCKFTVINGYQNGFASTRAVTAEMQTELSASVYALRGFRKFFTVTPKPLASDETILMVLKQKLGFKSVEVIPTDNSFVVLVDGPPQDYASEVDPAAVFGLLAPLQADASFLANPITFVNATSDSCVTVSFQTALDSTQGYATSRAMARLLDVNPTDVNQAQIQDDAFSFCVSASAPVPALLGSWSFYGGSALNGTAANSLDLYSLAVQADITVSDAATAIASALGIEDNLVIVDEYRSRSQQVFFSLLSETDASSCVLNCDGDTSILSSACLLDHWQRCTGPIIDGNPSTVSYVGDQSVYSLEFSAAQSLEDDNVKRIVSNVFGIDIADVQITSSGNLFKISFITAKSPQDKTAQVDFNALTSRSSGIQFFEADNSFDSVEISDQVSFHVTFLEDPATGEIACCDDSIDGWRDRVTQDLATILDVQQSDIFITKYHSESLDFMVRPTEPCPDNLDDKVAEVTAALEAAESADSEFFRADLYSVSCGPQLSTYRLRAWIITLLEQMYNDGLVSPTVLATLLETVSQAPTQLDSDMILSLLSFTDYLLNDLADGSMTEQTKKSIAESLSNIIEAGGGDCDIFFKSESVMTSLFNLVVSAYLPTESSAESTRNYNAVSSKAAVCEIGLTTIQFGDGSSVSLNSTEFEQDCLENAYSADVNIFDYADGSLATCFSNDFSLQQGDLLSRATNIFLPQDKTFEFTLPVDIEKMRRDESNPCLDDVGMPACEWFNETSLAWQTDGCEMTNAETVIEDGHAKCKCNHNTIFGIVRAHTLQPNLECVDGEPMINEDSTEFLSVMYILFAALYAVVLAAATYQVSRILYYTKKCEFSLVSTEHYLVAGIAFARMIAFIVISISDEIPAGVFVMLLSIPYFALYWAFTFVIATWGSIYHMKNSGGKHPFKRVKPYFIGTSLTVSVLMLVMMLSLAFISEDEQELRDQIMVVGSMVSGLINISTATGFILYGYRLIKKITDSVALTKKSADAKAQDAIRKLYRTAGSFAVVFIGISVLDILNAVLVMEGGEVTPILIILFLALDVAGLVILLVMFSGLVTDMAGKSSKISGGSRSGASNLSRAESTIKRTRTTRRTKSSRRVTRDKSKRKLTSSSGDSVSHQDIEMSEI